MKFYQIDPTTDARWAELVDRHPKASVFHSVGWLKALQHTYGYEPMAFTTSPPTEELKNGLVFCHIDSWLTGRRLVSTALFRSLRASLRLREESNFMIRNLQSALEHHKWKYVEIRPIHEEFPATGRWDQFPAREQATFCTRLICAQIRRSVPKFDKDSVQRRIQRAQRAGL